MDTSTQELMNMMEQMKDKLKKLGMEKVALQKENKKLKKGIEEMKETYFQRGFDAGREEYQVDTEYLEKKDKEIEELKEQNKELKKDLMEAEEFIEQVYDNTGNAHDSNEYLAEHISDLEQFSLAYQEQWDAWTEEQIEGDHWVQKS